MSTETVRRLRPAVHVAPVSDGLLFIGWQQTLVLHGSASLSRLWDALFPHLHRGVDVEVLLRALPETAQPTARTMLTQLDEQGFLLREDAADTDTAATHPEHRRTRAFLDSAATDPGAAQARLRAQSITVRGGGPVAASAARSLLRLGAGDVTVLDPTVRAELVGLAVEHGATLRATPRDHDTVLITVDEPAEQSVESVARVGVVQLGRSALIGPLQVHPGDPGVDLALQRFRTRGRDAQPAPTPPVAARLAGGLAALQVVHHVCGITTEQDGRTHLVDTERLATTTHPVAPRGAARAQPLSTRPGAEPARDALEDLTDERTGVLPPAEPGHLPQVPLALAETAHRGATASLGWAASGAVARYRSALESARRVAGPAPQRMWASTGEPRSVGPVEVAAGSDVPGMLAHGAQRLLAHLLADPGSRALRLLPGAPGALRDAGAPVLVRSALLRLAVLGSEVLDVTELTSTTSRLRAVPALFAVVEVTDTVTGRVLAVVAHPDEAHARALAVDHTTAVLAAGGQRDAVAQLAVPPWATGTEVELQVGGADLLDGLRLPGEDVVTARWSAEPAVDALGVVGWVGLTRIDRAGGSDVR